MRVCEGRRRLERRNRTEEPREETLVRLIRHPKSLVKTRPFSALVYIVSKEYGRG